MAFSVEFNLKINTLATNYSSHPITFGDPPAAAKWVWTFYVFGQDSDNLNGKLQVWGNTVENKFVPLSPISQVLNLNQTYHIKWSHNKAKGSQLYIDNNLIGTQGYTELDTTLSNNIWLKKNCYNGGGRKHSWFNGDVTNTTIICDDYHRKDISKMNINGINMQFNYITRDNTDIGEDDSKEASVQNDDTNYIKTFELHISSKYVKTFNDEEITQHSYWNETWSKENFNALYYDTKKQTMITWDVCVLQ
eukprot:989950_1